MGVDGGHIVLGQSICGNWREFGPQMWPYCDVFPLQLITNLSCNMPNTVLPSNCIIGNERTKTDKLVGCKHDGAECNRKWIGGSLTTKKSMSWVLCVQVLVVKFATVFLLFSMVCKCVIQ